jgi:hypothetical protein
MTKDDFVTHIAQLDSPIRHVSKVSEEPSASIFRAEVTSSALNPTLEAATLTFTLNMDALVLANSWYISTKCHGAVSHNFRALISTPPPFNCYLFVIY